jgi:small subunit ribosomal protein S1
MEVHTNQTFMSDETNPVQDEEVVKPTEETTPETPATTETPATETPVAEETTAAETAEEVVEAPPAEPEVTVAHDDFDWESGNRNKSPYSEAEIAQYLEKYDQTLTTLDENEIVEGIVRTIVSGDVIIDLNYKSDGLLALSEFRDRPDLKAGDTVEVYIEEKEDERGQLKLSRRKAKLLRAWEMIVDSYEHGTIIKGTIVSKTKGGLIADCNGLETFLPGSQIDIKPIIDYDQYVGKTMEFKVVKINEMIKNAVVSHKALIESDLAEQREAIIGGLEQGQVLEGVVKNITDFGAFMDLGGVDGLLYITDISWGRINHPSEVLELNQNLNVVVLDFNEDKRRISLGLKQLLPHPWDTLTEKIKEESTVKGKIVNIEDYGAFLEIEPGVEGLIHVSEVSWSNQPVNAREFFQLGQEFEAMVVTVDRDDRKMSLSIKKLTNDPWSEIDQKYPLNSRHTGKVKNLTPYGVFVELEEGIGGMVHISDLSWTKRYSHPSEFTKVNDDLEIVILEIDKDSRKLTLGHKQIEENPWDTFQNVFPVGSYHEATIVRKDDRGAIVQLPYGLEAYAPIRHVKLESGAMANVDETLTVKVLEFNRDDKRILVSHTRYLEDIRKEADESVRQEKDQERKQVDVAIKKQQSNLEPTTLGELDAFTQLKAQLATETTKKALAAKAKADAKAEAKAQEAKKAEEVAEEIVSESKEKATEAAAEVKEVEEDKTPKAEAEVKETEAKVADADDDLKEASKLIGKKVKLNDLTLVEGIGPKIASLLNESGVETWKQLGETKVEFIAEVLEKNSLGFHKPATWPKQAELAANGKWEELAKWQGELDGGKIPE